MGLATHVLMRPPVPPSFITHDEVLDYVANEFDRALYRTLVVGGEPSVLRKLTPRLRRHLLKVEAHWPWKKQAGAFPDTIEVLFVLTDMVSHALSGLALEEARKRGIPIIMGGRKHALNVEKLAAAGFPEVPLLAPKPAVSPKRTKADPVAKPLTVEVVAPLETVEPPIDAVDVRNAEPTAEEPTMPTPLPKTSIAPSHILIPRALLTGVGNKVLLALAADPGVSNVKMQEDFSTEAPQGSIAVSAVTARSVLGVVSPRTPAPNVAVDKAIYERACEALGVTPVSIPDDGTWPRSQKKTGRPTLGEREQQKADALRMKPAAEHRAPPKLVSPDEARRKPPSFSTVATVPSSEVPAPVRAAYEQQEQQRREEATTTVEALRLLLEAMRAENVSQISIRDDGTVSMERRVVVTSSMTL